MVELDPDYLDNQVRTYVTEEELARLNRYARHMGIKRSPAIRRLLLLGLAAEERNIPNPVENVAGLKTA